MLRPSTETTDPFIAIQPRADNVAGDGVKCNVFMLLICQCNHSPGIREAMRVAKPNKRKSLVLVCLSFEGRCRRPFVTPPGANSVAIPRAWL